MANPALIEDLRKQFADNPRRVFARLANEYRKSGDLDAAIEICRAQVPLQPTYISGYIVLGQALFERGDSEEARATFETALQLDPENLIALRQLGDIARGAGDLDGARGWYHKLLEVDPQNEEIAAQLAALEAPDAGSPADDAALAPVSWSDIHPDGPPAVPAPVLAPVPAPAAPARPRFSLGVIPEHEEAPTTEPAVPAMSVSAPDADAPEPVAPEPVAPEPVAEEELLPEYIAGYDRQLPSPFSEEPLLPEVELDADFELGSAMMVETSAMNAEMMPDIVEFAPLDLEADSTELPSISAPSKGADAGPTAAEISTLFAGPEHESPPDAFEVAEFVEEPYDPTVGRMLDLDRTAPSNALLPDLMMTESGAELLREQGHIDQAIVVYRHLAAKNPADSSYAERIAALERGARSSIPLVASISDEIITAAQHREHPTTSIRSFLTALAVHQLPTAGAPPAAAEPSSDGRSALESLFVASSDVPAGDERAAVALASAFSEEYATDPAGLAGRPTRAASDILSLDEVFRDSRSPAEDERRTSQPTVSFDEFFAPRENGDGANEGQRAGEVAIETTAPRDDSASDLELFHEWLDGLKK
jgi:tetratricopeptide (TPR) repeat protein